MSRQYTGLHEIISTIVLVEITKLVLEFAQALVGSWPLVASAALVSFRHDISRLLKRTTQLDLWGARAKFRNAESEEATVTSSHGSHPTLRLADTGRLKSAVSSLRSLHDSQGRKGTPIDWSYWEKPLRDRWTPVPPAVEVRIRRKRISDWLNEHDGNLSPDEAGTLDDMLKKLWSAMSRAEPQPTGSLPIAFGPGPVRRAGVDGHGGLR